MAFPKHMPFLVLATFMLGLAVGVAAASGW
jgi:hypothetical protein